MRPLDRRQSREVDRLAQERLLLPGDLLMENAGGHVARAALALARARGCRRAVVVAGPGNNGGDGLVAARHLLDQIPVSVVLAGAADNLAGDALANHRRLLALGVPVREVRDASALAALARDLAAPPAAVVIDALFGTGLSRAVTGLAREVIAIINAAESAVLAVDLPSGLDADTGEVLGAAVKATTTITFVAEKTGFALARGPEHTGRVEVVAIGFPPDALAPAAP